MISAAPERIVEINLGEDLSLRQLRVSDASPLRSIAVENMNYLGLHGEFNEREFASDDDTAKTIHGYENKGVLDFGISLRGQFIGNAILSPTIHNLEKMAAISYWVAEDYTGMGYATLAARAMVDYAFAEWNSCAVNALVRNSNHASRKVLQKAGLELVHVDDSGSHIELWSIDHPLIQAYNNRAENT